MATRYRCLWYDPDAPPGSPGHPLYLPPRQSTGRVDDPAREYRVLYLAADAAGAVAEVWGDFAVWTPALLDPPPNLPRALRAVVSYDVDATVCDLDDAKALLDFGLRPSQVVSHQRAVTQAWARQIHDTGQFDGVSWWSRRDPRWPMFGLWRRDGVSVATVELLLDLSAPAINEAADALLRPVGPR